jgi:hypothetical protein
MLGKSELFMISGGAAFKPIDYLKGKYEVGESYNKNRVDDQLSTKTIRSGAFVSFTYNLTNKQKE